jgi:energy-coupling factor transporter ATP-binding protein EcfA2
MIETKSLSLSFDDHPVFSGISEQFLGGGIYLIKGKNGSGKTSFLRCLCGIIPRHIPGDVSGSIVYMRDAQPIALSEVNIPHIFGYLMQEPDKQLCFPFIEEELFTGAENLSRNKTDFFRDYEHLIEMFPMLSDREIETSKLSFGEKKILLFSGMMLKNPDVYLLDEPLAGLSASYREKFLVLIRCIIDRGNIVIVAEHNDDMDSLANMVIQI